MLIKKLRDKTYEVVMNSAYDGYQTGLISMVFKFVDSVHINISLRSVQTCYWKTKNKESICIV